MKEILSKYFKDTSECTTKPVGVGAINETFLVERGDERFVLQKMSKIFDPVLMEDIEVVTEHLIKKNILTQRVVKTLDGKMHVPEGESWWRMLTYIVGEIYTDVSDIEIAKSAGELLGKFHTALSDLNYNFKFILPHYHDVEFDMQELKQVLVERKGTEKFENLHTLGESILDSYKNLKPINNLPRRIIHNDLKISNVVFDANSKKAVALIDLDTLSKSNIAVELGDALRSWCMPDGEDTESVTFDRDVYESALGGYYSTAQFLTAEEKEAIPYGVAHLALDLAARFTVDALRETYWRLDDKKYKSLYEQNKKRAENQYEFFRVFSSSFL